jgi:hypothetical protein
MTQLKEGGCQPRDREEHLSSASTVIARWQGMAGTSRVNREVYARFCGRLEVKSLRPTRQSASQAQRFLSAHAMIYGHFRPRRHLMAAAGYRRVRAKAFRTWRQETCVHQAA